MSLSTPSLPNLWLSRTAPHSLFSSSMWGFLSHKTMLWTWCHRTKHFILVSFGFSLLNSKPTLVHLQLSKTNPQSLPPLHTHLSVATSSPSPTLQLSLCPSQTPHSSTRSVLWAFFLSWEAFLELGCKTLEALWRCFFTLGYGFVRVCVCVRACGKLLIEDEP